MRRAVAVFAITFIMVGSIIAQVHIKENATIAPGHAKKVQTENVNNHTIRFEFYWSGADSGMVAMSRGAYFGDSCSFGTYYHSQASPLIIEINSPVADEYTFCPYIYAGGQVVSPVEYRLCSDGTLVDDFSTVITYDSLQSSWV
jgi:hypothetical protein